MPLLHKQKFIRKPIPANLDPNQHVFFSKLTQEIFLDYDEYFERTILCNSLVWTCSLTGKTGLTFAEALESEDKAKKVLKTFPYALERAILFLVTLTKRSNIKDLVDELFSYTKDRYFIGESVLVASNQGNNKNDNQKQFKIIDVIAPEHSSPTDEMKNISMSPTHKQKNGIYIDASKIKYIVELTSASPSQQTVNASQIIRNKNAFTKDKLYMIIKLNCEVNSQAIWALTDYSISKHKLNEITFKDIFKGDHPKFEQAYGRGQFSKSNIQGKLNESSNKNSPKKKNNNESSFNSSNQRKPLAESNKSNKLKSSKSTSNINKTSSSKNHNSSLNSSKRKSTTSLKEQSSNKKMKSSPSSAKVMQNKSNKTNESIDDFELDENFKFAQKVVQILAKKVIDMDDEEFVLWRDYIPDEDLKDITQLECEFDKILRKEEKEKERERLKNEKNKQKEYLKELKKPKEDFECENLMEIPKPVPIRSKITQNMFGDAVMILEFLNHFGELFEIKDDFPNGFNYELLENALFSKSCDSALCNLLLFYLDSILKCYDEETFDDSTADSDNESEYEDLNESDDEEITLENLYKDPLKPVQDRESFASLAENYLKLVKNSQGRSLKNIGLDVYTISEMLRLYFLTSASSHHSKTKFWYQQRGGYTRMDETGIDFVLNESNILKKLESQNVYELEPEEKLKILTCLCHQLMSQVRFRDLIEDNWQKISSLRTQLRDLQTEENRRVREEASERWKKKLQDKAKEKARLEENKTNNLSESTNNKENEINNDDIENKKLQIESMKKKEEFLKKEKHILDEINQLQNKYCMYPLGKDRYFRRYWVFKSLPGVFVEEDDYDFKLSLNYRQSNANMDVDDSVETDFDQINDGKENKPEIKTNFNGSSNSSLNKPSSTAHIDFQCYNEIFNNLISEADTNKTEIYTRNEAKWCFFYTNEQIELLINNLNERGLRESELKQSLIDVKDKIIDGLSKSVIIKNLTMSEEDIVTSIKNCLKENVNNVLANSIIANSANGQKNKRQTAKQVAAILQNNNYSSISSYEYMETDLRDKLLDIEEQIYVGALGSLKVNDRYKWKEALEQNQYDPQCSHLTWSDTTRSSSEVTNMSTAVENNTQANLVLVNNLAKALLQIEQSVERRFLRNPLGDSQKTPEKKRAKAKQVDDDNNEQNENGSSAPNKSILHNWEKSLMNCSTLSQIFIHLQTLDESIAWSKSVLKSACRICKRKKDGENMLLCDKCDRGHHIYCLRPPLKTIPEGEWFCPECKPKDVEKTPRKIRQSFSANATEDLYSDQSELNENDTRRSNGRTANKKRKQTIDDSNDDTNSNGQDEDENDQSEDDSNLTDDTNEENEENDQDYTSFKKSKKTQNKIKLNGNHLNGKNGLSDDDILIDESSDDAETRKKSTRKRKLVEEKKQNKSNNSSSSKENERASKVKSNIKFKQIKTRNKADNNQLSDKNGNNTDEDYIKPAKKAKSILNDFQINNTNSRNTEMVHRLKLVEKILNDLMKNPDSWPFLKPVSRREAPDYFEVIKTPMDFSTIKNNLNNFKYTDYTNTIDDIRLVFENCRIYNEPGSDIYITGQRMSSFFEKQAKQAGILDTKRLASPNTNKFH